MVIMKRISLWSAASLAVLSALALTLTGCTNEMDEMSKRVFVINPWKGDEVVIPINVDLKSDIELIGNRFNWELKKGQVQESHNPVAEGTEISDASSSEVTSKLALNAGLDMLLPPMQKPQKWGKGAAFSGSVKYGWSKSTKSSNEFEYHVDIYKKAFVAYYTGAKFTEEEMGAEQYTMRRADRINHNVHKSFEITG